jgi:hypothetical protein
MRENDREQNRLVADFKAYGFPEAKSFPALGLVFAAKPGAN